MATTAAAPSPSPSPWGKPGGWAQDLEKQEQEEQQQQQQQPLSDFPSLSAAAVTKTKKKKPQSVSLSEFTTGKSVSHGSYKPKGLTTDDLSILPTGPRQRSADEIPPKSYTSHSDTHRSNNNNSRYSNGDEDSSSRWGSSFNNNNNKDRDRDRGFNSAPSKADESDDWGAAKRSAPPPRDRASSRGNGSGFFDSQSKADESDSWLAKKSFVPSEQPKPKRDSNAAAADSNSTWGNNKRSSAGETGRPRLVLQPRSLPTNGDQPQPQPQPSSVTKMNPFGAARPREQVLAEKGQKIDDVVVSSASGRNSPADPTERSWRKTDPPTPSEEEDKPDNQGGDTELN